jgi:hypothetical protein
MMSCVLAHLRWLSNAKNVFCESLTRFRLFSLAAAITLACSVSAAQAAGTLAYSFETGTDGFGPNLGGAFTQDTTTGATEGASSLKAVVPTGSTFVGALTSNLHPSIGDPPGLSHVLFDMTITEPFAGSFAVVGVTVFGCTQGGASCGNQAQFADFEHIGGKSPGTYTDIRIDLDSSLDAHPITFQSGLSFDEMYGPNPGAPFDIIPTGFQLYFNKSNDAPLTVYIDNIRTVVPEPTTSSMFGLGVLAFVTVVRRHR